MPAVPCCFCSKPTAWGIGIHRDPDGRESPALKCAGRHAIFPPRERTCTMYSVFKDYSLYHLHFWQWQVGEEPGQSVIVGHGCDYDALVAPLRARGLEQLPPPGDDPRIVALWAPPVRIPVAMGFERDDSVRSVSFPDYVVEKHPPDYPSEFVLRRFDPGEVLSGPARSRGEVLAHGEDYQSVVASLLSLGLVIRTPRPRQFWEAPEVVETWW